MSTVTVVDHDRVGRKGFPMHSLAFPEIALPTKEVPASEATPGQAVDPKQALTLYAAQKRWEKETGGIVFGGMVISTDDRSKIMISGARVAAEADPNFTTQWKGADGSFVTLVAAMIVAISNAVSTHVSNCFALEAQVLAQIEAGTITTATEIDAAFA